MNFKKLTGEERMMLERSLRYTYIKYRDERYRYIGILPTLTKENRKHYKTILIPAREYQMKMIDRLLYRVWEGVKASDGTAIFRKGDLLKEK